MKKYELIPERNFFRIKALKDFGDVKKGELGGLVLGEHNLSQEGDCWVSDNAQISGNTRVSGDARVSDNAWVSGDARVSDNAWVSGNARVSGDAWIRDNAQVSGDAWVCGGAIVTVNVITFGNAFIYDITVTNKHIRIGCEQHLKEDWKNFSDDEIVKMDGKSALKFWRLFKPLAEQMGLFN